MFALLSTSFVLLEMYVTHMHVRKLVKTTKKKPFYSLPQWSQDNHMKLALDKLTCPKSDIRLAELEGRSGTSLARYLDSDAYSV